MSRFASDNHMYEINKINPFIPILWPLPGEYWKEITDIAAPGVFPWYAISNYGRIVHIYRNALMSLSWDGPGYTIVVLRTNEGNKTFRVHRLMMLTFRYFEGCENLFVDHVYGNKHMNFLDFPVFNPETGVYELKDGLKWTTRQKNFYDAFNDPEQRQNNKISLSSRANDITINPDQAKQICELLQEGKMTYKEIAQETNSSKAIVQNIRFKKCWQDISENYVFRDKSLDQRGFNEFQVREICELIMKKVPMPQIAKKYGVKTSCIKNIKYGKVYMEITKDYNLRD